VAELTRAGFQDATAAASTLSVLMRTFNETPARIGDMLMQTALTSGSRVDEIAGIMKENADLLKSMGWSLKDAASLSGMDQEPRPFWYAGSRAHPPSIQWI